METPILFQGTVRIEGTYQTMLGISSFNFLRKSFPGSGVFIALVLPKSDSVCGEDIETETFFRRKSFPGPALAIFFTAG